MITGFNTDIEHDGVVYHVQTEDKGLESPLILSLVYSGGAILASKRSRYEDLISSGFDEELLAQRLKRQHRLICAAINAGRIEDLKRMGRSEIETESPEIPPTVVEEPTAAPESPTTPDFAADESVPEPPPSTVVSSGPEDIQSLLVSNASDFEAMVEANSPRPQPPPPPPPPPAPVAPTVEVPSQPRGTETSVYTVHDSRRGLPIRNAGKVEQGVVVTILDEEEFRAGQIFNIRVMIQNMSGGTGKPLGGIALSVKILGTTFRPQLYTVKTGRDGVAVVSAQIPHFTSGRAAILIQANAEGKTLETRRVIHAAL